MTNKEKYRQFCEEVDALSIFEQAWWLDAVCGESNWDVALHEKSNQILASLPYEIRKKIGFKYLVTPNLTQSQGPYIKPSNSSRYSKGLSHNKKLIYSLNKQLPKVDFINLRLSKRITNWLPFHWLGYQQTTRYTYSIKDLSDLDKVYKDFESNIKTDIKKADALVNIIEEDTIEQLYAVISKTFDRKKMNNPVDKQILKKIDESAKNRMCRKILIAKDSQGNVHAGIYLVWDKKRMYYLFGGGDPKYRNSGATSFLLWNAIQFASKKVEVFDFEGSMLEPVEKFIRGFGSKQEPYFELVKFNSKLLHLIYSLKTILLNK